MRVLFLSATLGDAYGQERILNDSNAMLRNAGHETFFIASHLSGDAPPHHELFKLPELAEWNTLSNPLHLRTGIQELLNHLARIRPDVIHWIDLFDPRIMKAVSQRYPSVFTAHTVASTCPSSQRFFPNGGGVCSQPSGWRCMATHSQEGCLGHFKTSFHRLHALFEFQQKKNLLKTFPVLGAISPYVQECLERDGFLKHHIVPIYNPVGVSEPKLLPPPARPLLVVASRLVALKGISALILSLSELRHLHWDLWIFGDGPQRPDLEALTQKLKLDTRIIFQGKRPLHEVHAAMKQARAFIQPNRGPEGFGMAVAEAAALGTPVVAYDVPALNFLIQNEKTGFLVPLHPETGLARPIEKLLNSPELAHTLGQAGARWVQQQFSPENHLKQTLTAYQKALATFRSSPIGIADSTLSGSQEIS